LRTTATTIPATATNRKPKSLCLTKYIKNIQQANRRTALEYEYRLSKFEKYVVVAAYQQQYQKQNQDQKLKTIITSLDQVIEELKRSNSTLLTFMISCLALSHIFKKSRA
jgi:hypothetical protein